MQVQDLKIEFKEKPQWRQAPGVEWPSRSGEDRRLKDNDKITDSQE